MKVFGLLLSMIAFVSCQRTPNSIVARAINGLLNDYFAKGSQKVDLIYYHNVSERIEPLIGEILGERFETISFQVSKAGQENLWKNQLNISSFLIFDSAESFRSIKHSITWLSKTRIRFPHLVYFPNATISDFEDIQDGFSIDNVDFLVNETENTIELVTGFMFSENKCHQNHFATINIFDGKTKRWENSNFYPQKYQNFYNCPLKLASKNVMGTPAVEFRLIRQLDKYFHFVPTMRSYNDKTLVQKFHSNQLDFVTSPEQIHDHKFYVSSVPFIYERLSFAVPPGVPYTAFEKMFLPFNEDLWLAILVTFAVSFVVIQVINFSSREVQNFVFGRKIKNPTLNLIDIFLNGGQNKVPQRNFSRFLLMMFIIWSLIIRTCYQSQYFKFLQSDMRKPPIRTFQDFYDRNFSQCNALNEPYPFFRSKNPIDCGETLSEILDYVAEPINKATIEFTQEFFEAVLTTMYHRGYSSLTFLKETLQQAYSGVTMRHSYLEAFNEKIGLMMSNGIASLLIPQHMRRDKVKKVIEVAQPQVLTLDDLQVGFKFCLVPLCLSVISFIFEVSSASIKSFLQSFIDKLVAVWVIKALSRVSARKRTMI